MDTRLQQILNGYQPDYIAPFLWLHGEDDALILDSIHRIYDSGVRSVCLESRTHEEFCGDGWWSDVALIFEECRKLGMRVWILDDKHFPSGYANGIFENKYPELRPWGVTEFHLDVAGPVRDGAAIADGWKPDDGDEILAVAALRHVPEEKSYDAILDLTDGLSDGMVYFDLPEGMWRIVFIIRTRSGIHERYRVFCNMLCPEAPKRFLEEVYQPHYDRFAPYFGNTFRGFFSDEPSFLNNTRASSPMPTIVTMGEMFVHHPWETCVGEELKARFGANALHLLAGMWFNVPGVSEKIRYAFMDIVTETYRKNFSELLGTWCREHHVDYIGHVIEDNNTHATTGHGTGHYFRALAGQQMSGIDVVLHQIMPGLTECSNAGCVSYRHMEQDFFNYVLAKLGSSYAHFDPQKRGRAMCEIFGAYGWGEGSKIMKYLTDHMLVRGINYYVPHAFSPKPNDPDCPPNFYHSGKNPQYPYFGRLMDHMNRMSYLLSDAVHIPTCAILYDAENRWVRGDFLPEERVAKRLYDSQLDYDILPADVIGKIGADGLLNGERYPLLLVPYAEPFCAEAAEKLKTCKIPVVVVTDGKKPANLPYPSVTLDALPSYLERAGLRDVRLSQSAPFLRYCHYRRDGADLWYFVNENVNEAFCGSVMLSSFAGGTYAVYDAFEHRAYRRTQKSGKIRLDLPPYHAVLIVCGDVDIDGIPAEKRFREGSSEELHPTFTVSAARGGEEKFTPLCVTDQLFNVTGRDHDPRFAGRIRYEAAFSAAKKAGKRVLLDLGNVGEIADVTVNGKRIGDCLFPPYRFDVTGALKSGENELTVTVATHCGYAERDRFTQFLLLEPMGLLGPIRLIEEK